MGVLALFSTFVEKNHFYIAKEKKEGEIVRDSVYTDTQTHTYTCTVMQTTHPLSRNNSGELTFLLACNSTAAVSSMSSCCCWCSLCVCADNTQM